MDYKSVFIQSSTWWLLNKAINANSPGMKKTHILVKVEQQSGWNNENTKGKRLREAETAASVQICTIYITSLTLFY